MLLERGVRRIALLLAWFAALGACTPEAIEVDPSGGSAGQDPSGNAGDPGRDEAGTGGKTAGSEGGSAGLGGSMPGGGKPSGTGGGACAPLESPKQSCTECIPRECPAEASACEGNACTCGDFRGYPGQMNCLLACTTLSPMLNAADVCATQCGFGSLSRSDPATHQLFDCLVRPPNGPPRCPDCFPIH
jgi:hypothetical protein